LDCGFWIEEGHFQSKIRNPKSKTDALSTEFIEGLDDVGDELAFEFNRVQRLFQLNGGDNDPHKQQYQADRE